MKLTGNYGLKKPDYDDEIDIADLNFNIDKIDTKFKQIDEKVLEHTLTSITTDSTLTKLDNCEGGFVHNMHIKGKTLQNLWNNENVVSLKNDAMLIQTISTDDFRTNMLKDNIEYSIVNLSNKKTRADITTKNSNAYVKTLYIEPHSIQKFTISSQYISSFYGLISEGWTNTDSDRDIFKKACMILEGDYTNKEIPQYFEGIKSVGEAEDNKISILTKGKNFAKIQNDIEIKNGIEGGKNNSCSLKEGLYYVNAYDTNNNNVLSPNIAITFYEGSKQGEAWIPIAGKNQPINLKQISNNFRIFWNTNALNATISKISITKNPISNFNEYEQYKADKTEILLPSPHCGLPDGTSDIVYYDKNERIKNVDKALFNGDDEKWCLHPYSNSNFSLFYNYSVIGFFVNCLSNKFPLYNGSAESLKQETQEYIWGQGKGVFIWIKNDKLETPDANGFKKLLKSWADAGTSLEVYYQLVTPVVEKLSIKDTLQTFQDGYIQLNNAITPCTQLEYSTNIPSAIGGLTKVVDHNVDEITNIESTISDMDAEIGEARKGKTTLEERLEEDKKEINLQLKEIEQNYYSLNNAIPIPSNSDLNNYTEPGNYFSAGSGISNTLTNCPFTDGAFALKVERITIGTAINLRQILKANSSNVITCERNCLNGTWLEKWKQLSTVEDTGWIDLPLASGITVDGKITPQYRRVNNQVFICGSILGVDSTAKTVAILPVGFRPSRANYYVGFTTGTYINAIRIDSNGNIIVQSNSSGVYDSTRFATLGTNFII
ncbi:pyocin knob domain-containing protein [Clostridium botulinum]|uniref:pyocin knob domain-containing protein n=1 Tax=Clostridium botulinum TaxID=1491 RepID=UPI001968564A|nr:pyocin knob domain-containing protein [Clostridium botulinum]MBN1079258.1 hypothetical protein [Clostridium botulinum]